MQKKRRRRRSNPMILIPLLIVVCVALYFFGNFIADPPTPLFQPTVTATRDPEALFNQAASFYESGNLERAIEAYREIVMVDAGNPSVYTELARLQILNAEYEAAETSARNALLLSPENPDALAMLAWSVSFLGRSAEAEEALLRAINADPNHALSHAIYAEVLADQGDYERAGVESRTAYDLAPERLEVLRSRGYVLELTGNYDEAIDFYERALAINGNISDLYISLGRAYRALGLYDEAIAAFVQANALNPSDPLPDTYQTLIYLTTGEYGKAVQSAEKAVEEDAANPYRYGNLGVALYRNEQYADAIGAFAYAIQGGTTETGGIVQGLPLDYGEIAQYYQLYMLSLAYENQCGESLRVAQSLLANLQQDENATYNANYAIEYCGGVAEAAAAEGEEEGDGVVELTPEGGLEAEELTPTPEE
ncbi:MAG: tetratricopeptide repeat protein [Anaerolineales bacterium]|nr:tetratricopeptide repeat protein [Anaerolineales bacterium]